MTKMRVGKAFVKEGKRGEKKLEVALVLDDKVVSRIHLNNATGEILPKGLKSPSQTVTISLDQAAAMVTQVLPNLQVGSALLDKDGHWKVGLTLKGAVVADLRINGQDGSVLTDWKAARDVERWGK